ncbi:COG1669 Predicted nucleotidyltransferases [Fimbriimonadaceae bacterium]
MNALEVLATNRDEIATLCRRYAVKRLRVFGSALSSDWREESSDFDFLVDYGVEAKMLPPLDRLVGLKLALESLLGRKVDVVNVAQLRNARFREFVDRQARDFYAA